MSTPKKDQSRRKKKLLVPVISGLSLLGLGAGAGIAAAKFGMFGGGSDAVRKHQVVAVQRADPKYVSLDQGFTSNLKGSESFVQASVAISTRGGDAVVDAIKSNEPALRSVVLQTLADQDYASVSTAAGRRTLLVELRKSLDRELKERVGSGGIENVYFTGFVLQ